MNAADWRVFGGVPQEGEVVKLELRGGKELYCEVLGLVSEGLHKGLAIALGKGQETFVPLRESEGGARYCKRGAVQEAQFEAVQVE